MLCNLLTNLEVAFIAHAKTKLAMDEIKNFLNQQAIRILYPTEVVLWMHVISDKFARIQRYVRPKLQELHDILVKLCQESSILKF